MTRETPKLVIPWRGGQGLRHVPRQLKAAVEAAEKEAGETLWEWRWWESTGQWTYTGRMGLGIKPSHPNSKLFLHGIDPNKEAQS